MASASSSRSWCSTNCPSSRRANPIGPRCAPRLLIGSGGKVIRDGMGQSQRRAAEIVDTVITNALIVDAKAGIVKAGATLVLGETDPALAFTGESQQTVMAMLQHHLGPAVIDLDPRALERASGRFGGNATMENRYQFRSKQPRPPPQKRIGGRKEKKCVVRERSPRARSGDSGRHLELGAHSSA